MKYIEIERYCGNCDGDTQWCVESQEHKRDSAGDIETCLYCGWWGWSGDDDIQEPWDEEDALGRADNLKKLLELKTKPLLTKNSGEIPEAENDMNETCFTCIHCDVCEIKRDFMKLALSHEEIGKMYPTALACLLGENCNQYKKLK